MPYYFFALCRTTSDSCSAKRPTAWRQSVSWTCTRSRSGWTTWNGPPRSADASRPAQTAETKDATRMQHRLRVPRAQSARPSGRPPLQESKLSLKVPWPVPSQLCSLGAIAVGEVEIDGSCCMLVVACGYTCTGDGTRPCDGQGYLRTPRTGTGSLCYVRRALWSFTDCRVAHRRRSCQG